MKRYQCVENSDHNLPETVDDREMADSGTCPTCGAEMDWADFPDEEWREAAQEGKY